MEESVILQTRLGRLKGLVQQSVLTGKPYYSFRGIPYGKPPLGELRFKAPQPFGSWEGTRDALKDGNASKQPVLATETQVLADGDEDCLYLNVYFNQLPEKGRSKKPVLVSIHGGGFLLGSGNSKTNGPDFLLYEDIIVVTFNYRCGAFGFLSLESDDVPGNAGLKDQTLALKWVRDNIDSFGGDPKNVTIFGISAGGASVAYNLISPLSRGLFHKAIIQSGFALNPWALQHDPKSRAIKLAKVLGCEASEDPDFIVRFLQSVPADEIVGATQKIAAEKEYTRNYTLVFMPCVEISGSDPFLSDTPEALMQRGEFAQVPVILGCTVKEGSVAAFFDGVSDRAFKSFNDNPEWLVSPLLGLKHGSVEEKEATKIIWDFYLKGKHISWNNANDYLLCQSDVRFNIGMEQTRTMLLEKSSAPVYTYLFTNHTRCICQLFKTVFAENASKVINSESCHGADLQFLYLFRDDRLETPELTHTEKEAIKKHVKAWASFASTGNPNYEELRVTWKKDSKENPCFMEIGESWKARSGHILPDRTNFWMGLASKYHKIWWVSE
ncbi:hypothetical protein J6590_016228 [Homalodisca vitripennis]|nr:hypothetical protein J6590_016228 [Homalodisca vitripennis]